MAGAEKMSKSLGNVVTVAELLEQGHKGETLRLALLSAHYRQPLEWSPQLIAQSKATPDRQYRAAGDAVAAREASTVIGAVSDDLNPPTALSRPQAITDPPPPGTSPALRGPPAAKT